MVDFDGSWTTEHEGSSIKLWNMVDISVSVNPIFDDLPFFALLVWPRETWCGFRLFPLHVIGRYQKKILQWVHNSRLGFQKWGTKQVWNGNLRGGPILRSLNGYPRLPISLSAPHTTAPALRGGPPRCLARGAPPGWPRSQGLKHCWRV